MFETLFGWCFSKTKPDFFGRTLLEQCFGFCWNKEILEFFQIHFPLFLLCVTLYSLRPLIGVLRIGSLSLSLFPPSFVIVPILSSIKSGRFFLEIILWSEGCLILSSLRFLALAFWWVEWNFFVSHQKKRKEKRWCSVSHTQLFFPKIGYLLVRASFWLFWMESSNRIFNSEVKLELTKCLR